MRVAFLLAILFIAALYTYTAFDDLRFLSATGRLGPGFFPRIIGGALVIVCLYSLFTDIRSGRLQAAGSPYWHVAALVALLSGVFIGLLNVLGGVLAMMAFLFAALSMLNRDHWLQNGVISLVLPTCVYLLFDVWLRASMPEGILPLPL